VLTEGCRALTSAECGIFRWEGINPRPLAAYRASVRFTAIDVTDTRIAIFYAATLPWVGRLQLVEIVCWRTCSHVHADLGMPRNWTASFFLRVEENGDALANRPSADYPHIKT
jgi:hypothetical protein